MPGSKAHVVRGTGREAVAGIEALSGSAVLPRLDVPSQQHPGGTKRCGPQPTKNAPAPTVSQHLVGEYVLPDPDRCQEDPLGLQFRRHARVGVSADLVAQAGFEHGDVEFLLAEQG
jgi:hypothetical protein